MGLVRDAELVGPRSTNCNAGFTGFAAFPGDLARKMDSPIWLGAGYRDRLPQRLVVPNENFNDIVHAVPKSVELEIAIRPRKCSVLHGGRSIASR